MTRPELLYIDDTSADAELMCALLEPQGVMVHIAYMGSNGIHAYDPAKHHAVVIDWNLPDMEGLEVAEELRALYPECPVAFLSGAFEDRHLKAAGKLGIPCFEKAFDMRHIDYVKAFVCDAAQGRVRKEAYG